MGQPILSEIGLKYYVPVWSVVGLIHGMLLYFYFEFSLEIAAVDSLVYNVIFASLAPGLWYIVSFAGVSKDSLSVIATHVVAALILVVSWAGLCGFVVGSVFSLQEDYIQFLSQAYIGRLILGTIYYSIVVLVFYLIKNFEEIQIRERNEVELQSMLKDSELRMLKAQINPHFIFNSLNSISSLTLSKPELAREMVIKLSDFLRYSLGKDSIQMNTLNQEIENMMLYLDMEKVRFGDKLEVEKRVGEDCLDALIPNLILQPLIENAIKYGVYESVEKVRITIACEIEDEVLVIKIANGFDPNTIPQKGEGIGLNNVRKRLSLVYNRTDLLDIEKKKGDFVVTIKVPLQQNEED